MFYTDVKSFGFQEEENVFDRILKIPGTLEITSYSYSEKHRRPTGC